MRLIISSMMLLIFVFYIFNNEFFSVKMYEKYKLKELEIRNNLKLGLPSENKFHIDDHVSIFFESKNKSNNFFDVESIIYSENQFIKSRSLKIETSKKSFNLIFYNGERLKLNEDEKSITNFDKFTYSIDSKKIEDLLMDKEHYNTLQLISHEEKDFINHGHNKIYQYFLTLIVIFFSSKVILFYKNNQNILIYFFYFFLFFIFLFTFNNYLIYMLNNTSYFQTYYYYILNVNKNIKNKKK